MYISWNQKKIPTKSISVLLKTSSAKKGYDTGKTERIRKKFLKSGQGRKWLAELEACAHL